MLMVSNGVSELSEDCKLANSTYSKYQGYPKIYCNTIVRVQMVIPIAIV